MIRKMKEEDLQQCAVIYAKAFPIEYWGIDWNPDNAKELCVNSNCRGLRFSDGETDREHYSL